MINDPLEGCLLSWSRCGIKRQVHTWIYNRPGRKQSLHHSMPIDITTGSLGSKKIWVRSYILQDLCSLPSSVVHLILIDTVRDLLNRARKNTINL